MKKLVLELSQKAIQLGDFEFEINHTAWIGNLPATTESIETVEKRLNIELPEDYKEFLKISNGFPAVNTIEPTFLPIEEVDYLKKLDPQTVSIEREYGIEEIADKLERAIIVAGPNEEQSFLLIPPGKNQLSWEYWKFANWIPGEEPYENLEHYFSQSLQFIHERIKER